MDSSSILLGNQAARSRALSWARLAALGACLTSGSACSNGAEDRETNDGGVEPSDAGADAATGDHAALELTPSAANVLTCSQQSFTVTTTGLEDKRVNFSIAPASSGSIDAQGLYLAPHSTPSPAQVTVTATSQADTSLSASATVTLATAFPSPPKRVAGSSTDGAAVDGLGGVYEHGTVARGQRVYTVWRTGDGAHKADLVSARSDDGGATWKDAVTALHVTTPDDASSPPTLTCASLAIDAGDPNVLYAVTAVGSWDNSVADSVLPGAGAGGSIALMVSTDGGATFKTYVLKVTNGGPGICPDVISPAADTVVVSVPNPDNNDTKRDIGIWSDATRGAGFAHGTGDEDLNYISDGETGALTMLAPMHSLRVQESSADGVSGGEWESPRLFTDGKGDLCITYTAQYQDNAHPDDLTNAYVQCSKDAGKTFSAKIELDTQAQGDTHRPDSAVGAMDASGHLAVAWSANDGQSWITLALSDDGGATFHAPVRLPTLTDGDVPLDGQANLPSVGYDERGILWVAYAPIDGGFNRRVVIDKSCDHGTTWSGPVLLSGPLANPAVQLTKPSIVLTEGDAPHVMAYEDNYDDGSPLNYLSLAP